MSKRTPARKKARRDRANTPASTAGGRQDPRTSDGAPASGTWSGSAGPAEESRVATGWARPVMWELGRGSGPPAAPARRLDLQVGESPNLLTGPADALQHQATRQTDECHGLDGRGENSGRKAEHETGVDVLVDDGSPDAHSGRGEEHEENPEELERPQLLEQLQGDAKNPRTVAVGAKLAVGVLVATAVRRWDLGAQRQDGRSVRAQLGLDLEARRCTGRGLH